MLFTYPAYVSRTFNDRIYPLAAIAIQKLILSKKISAILDTMMSSIPEMKSKKTVYEHILESKMNIFPNKNIDLILEQYKYNNINLKKIHKVAHNTCLNLGYIKNNYSKSILEASIEFAKSKLNAPTMATVERRDPDGYMRQFLVGVYLKTIYMKPDVLKIFLTGTKSKIRNILKGMLHKLANSVPVLNILYRWFDVLLTIIKRKASFSDKFKQAMKLNLYKKIVIRSDNFIFISEADLLDTWGEEIPLHKFKDFWSDLGWRNYIIDLPSMKSIVYIGEYSGGGANIIPYNLLLAEISDRLKLEDYETIASKSDRGMRFHISMGKAFKLINKAVKR